MSGPVSGDHSPPGEKLLKPCLSGSLGGGGLGASRFLAFSQMVLAQSGNPFFPFGFTSELGPLRKIIVSEESIRVPWSRFPPPQVRDSRSVLAGINRSDSTNWLLCFRLMVG